MEVLHICFVYRGGLWSQFLYILSTPGGLNKKKQFQV